MHSPPAQASGMNRHSFKSIPVSSLPGPSGHNLLNSSGRNRRSRILNWDRYLSLIKIYIFNYRYPPEDTVRNISPMPCPWCNNSVSLSSRPFWGRNIALSGGPHIGRNTDPPWRRCTSSNSACRSVCIRQGTRRSLHPPCWYTAHFHRFPRSSGIRPRLILYIVLIIRICVEFLLRRSFLLTHALLSRVVQLVTERTSAYVRSH